MKGERRGGCLDHVRGAAQHRAEGHGRGLPGDAGALGPGERYRHPRLNLARLEQAQGQEALDQDWVSRSDPEAKIAKICWPARGGSGHRRGGGGGAAPGRRGRLLPKMAAAEANLEAVDVAPTAEDPAECVTAVGLEGVDDGPWKSRISEPKQKGFARWHGDDAARSPTTGPGCFGKWPGKPSMRAEIVEALLCPQPRSRRYAPDLASGPRERAQAIPASRRRPQPIVADAPTHRRRHPEGGRGGRNWRLVRLLRPLIVLIVSEERYASPWRETRSMTPFSTGLSDVAPKTQTKSFFIYAA